MKTTITRAALAEAAQAVKGLVAKDGLSPFSRIRLDASGCLSVTGSNGDVQVEWRLDGDVTDRGTVTVPGAAFAAFVAAMPEGTVEISAEHSSAVKSRVTMEGDGVRFKLAAGEAADFYVMLGPNKAAALEINVILLREMLRKVRFAVSTDLTRKSLTGVNVALKGGLLGMTATDGCRLAHVEQDLARQAEHSSAFKASFNVTLPIKAVGALYGLLEKTADDDLVAIAADGKSVRFVGGTWCLTAKVLEEIYPNWQKVVPGELPHSAVLDRGKFLEAMGRAALADDGTSGVKITLRNTSVAFEAKNDITAANAGMAACKMENGVKGEFRVDPRLLKDALESIDEDDFTLHFDDDGKKPIKLTCSLPWVAVVMPLQKMGKEG